MSRSIRPSTPPASLTRLKAVSIPSFIWRPSSFAVPEKGAAIPNRISRSLTPRVGVLIRAVGAVAAGDRPFEMSELAVCYSAINLSRYHSATAVRDTAIEQLRKVVTLSLVGRGFLDHSRELVGNNLNTGPRDIPAGQR